MNGSRVPPNNIEAQEAVLSALMLHPDAFDLVSGKLKPEHFYGDQHKHIMEAIVALHTAGTPVDMVSVHKRLRDQQRDQQVGGSQALVKLTQATPAIANVSTHADTIIECWRLRQLISLCNRYGVEAYHAGGAEQELIENAERELSALAHVANRVDLELLFDVADRQRTVLDEARTRGTATVGIPSGYADLDKMLAGLFTGDLYIIAGRPGMGKSGIACCLALRIAKPRGSHPAHGVAFFSLEMPREQMAMRFTCCEGRIDSNEVRHGRFTDQGWTDLCNTIVKLHDLPIWIDDQPAITLLELRSRIRKLKREIENGSSKVKCEGLKVVFIDYLQLMGSPQVRGQTREQQVAEISKGLKNMAKEEDIVVIAMSQLNRGVERDRKEKRPLLSDLRESGSIEQDADCVMFVFRPIYYDKGGNKRDAEVIVAKQRNGPTGTVEMVYDAKYTRFDDKQPGDGPPSYGDGDDSDQFEDIPDGF